MVNPEAIVVEGQGQPVGGAELLEQGDVAVQVLGRTEVEGAKVTAVIRNV